jgi:hypothetical protein
MWWGPFPSFLENIMSSVKKKIKEQTEPVCNDADVSVQAEYIALYNVRPFDEEQNLYQGQVLPQMQKQLKNCTDRMIVIFQRNYDPDKNDIDKVYPEIKFDRRLTNVDFNLVPFNKVRLFYTPESFIKVVTNPKHKRILAT